MSKFKADMDIRSKLTDLERTCLDFESKAEGLSN